MPTVAVPRIFLRGNRWYVRVQVPAAMKADLGRVEYWVSLRTSDRSVALQRAAGATLNKPTASGLLRLILRSCGVVGHRSSHAPDKLIKDICNFEPYLLKDCLCQFRIKSGHSDG